MLLPLVSSCVNHPGFKYKLNEGDEVVLTKSEHASNILPWFALSKEIGIKVRYIPLNSDYEVTIENVKKVMIFTFGLKQFNELYAFFINIIKKYYSNSSEQDDLVSIGTIGLIKGVNTYKLDKNIKLATYASRCIENEILMYLRKNKRKRTRRNIV